MIILNIPQLIMIILIIINFVYSLSNHGKPKDEKYNVWVTLTAIVIHVALMKWGGFF